MAHEAAAGGSARCGSGHATRCAYRRHRRHAMSLASFLRTKSLSAKWRKSRINFRILRQVFPVTKSTHLWFQPLSARHWRALCIKAAPGGGRKVHQGKMERRLTSYDSAHLTLIFILTFHPKNKSWKTHASTLPSRIPYGPGGTPLDENIFTLYLAFGKKIKALPTFGNSSKISIR